MPMNRGRATGAFLENLMDGDPVALGIAGSFVLFAAVVGLVILKIKRDHRREDEERDRRRGIKPKKK
jgi:hypothetical protein